jgi:hypothetical protein
LAISVEPLFGGAHRVVGEVVGVGGAVGVLLGASRQLLQRSAHLLQACGLLGRGRGLLVRWCWRSASSRGGARWWSRFDLDDQVLDVLDELVEPAGEDGELVTRAGVDACGQVTLTLGDVAQAQDDAHRCRG